MKFLLILSFAVLSTTLYSNTGTPDSKKTENQEEVQNAPEKEQISETTQERVADDNQIQDEESSEISNSSFNYFFYLIYKIKFEDIFKLPGQSASKIRMINLNALIEKIAKPRI